MSLLQMPAPDRLQLARSLRGMLGKPCRIAPVTLRPLAFRLYVVRRLLHEHMSETKRVTAVPAASSNDLPIAARLQCGAHVPFVHRLRDGGDFGDVEDLADDRGARHGLPLLLRQLVETRGQ